MTASVRHFAAVIATIAFTACAGGSSRSARGTAPHLIRATAPEWPDTAGWRIDSTPELVLGRVDTDLASNRPGQAFSDVRGAVRLSDGRIIVAEASTQELRVFDSTGRYVGEWGRRGGGPGEFRGLDGVFSIPGDTVIALDLGLERITEFSRAGAVIATVGYPGFDHVDGALSGVRLLVRRGFDGYKPGAYPPALKPVDIVNPRTNRRESLGRYHTQGNAVVEAARMHSVIPLSFSVGALGAASGDEAAVGDPDSARSIAVFTDPAPDATLATKRDTPPGHADTLTRPAAAWYYSADCREIE
ncbi:MAG TPA: 6-bladed beta-propeller [Gemmatimonadales bacterium]|nr:6-bladed beta-propeller [Gemmatimonadales bacterium]